MIRFLHILCIWSNLLSVLDLFISKTISGSGYFKMSDLCFSLKDDVESTIGVRKVITRTLAMRSSSVALWWARTLPR